jgi:glutathione S-transferase
MTLGKFIVFINDAKNAEFIRKIAGRHPHIDSQAQTYCAAEGQEAIENPSKALKGKSTNRYYMVNTTCLRRPEADRLGVRYAGERNFNTIELRVFRASLKKERLLAQIEFTHAVIMFCRIASMRDLDGVSFLKWLKTTDNRYPHLSDWYGIRRRVGAKNAAPTEVNCADTLVDTASA